MSRPFHLVVYTDARERGGAEVTLGLLLSALPDQVRVTIVGFNQDVVDWLASQRPGVVGRLTPRITSRSDLASFWRHRRLFAELRPDILHFNLSMGSSCQWAMVVGATMRGVPLVAVENSSMGAWSEASRRLKRAISSRLDAHVAVGVETARSIERDLGLATHAIETVYHGVPDVRRDTDRDPHDGPVIVNVARRHQVKGVDVLLDAMTRVDPAVKLVQIGGGEESDSLAELRDRLKLGDRVEFRDLPWGQRAADRLAAFDLFVLPSRNEGFPVTIMEAMLAGLPVVTTDVGSVREAVGDGETGLIVPPEDPAALAAAISALVADPDRRAAMGQRARAIAVERFTLSATVERYMAVYERVLGDKR